MWKKDQSLVDAVCASAGHREDDGVDREARILIVDDDPDYVETTRAVLRSYGYALDVAHGGDEALAMMRKNPPDLVILDVIMSWPLEGVTVSREMMMQAKLRSIPILMVTSVRDSEYGNSSPRTSTCTSTAG